VIDFLATITVIYQH